MLCNSTLFETTDCWPFYADPPHCAPPPLSFLSQRLIAEPGPFSSLGRKATGSHGFNQSLEAAPSPSPSLPSCGVHPAQPRGHCGSLSREWCLFLGTHNQETWHLLSIGSIISPHNPHLTHPSRFTNLPSQHTLTTDHCSFNCVVLYAEWACLLWVCTGRWFRGSCCRGRHIWLSIAWGLHIDFVQREFSVLLYLSKISPE